MLRKAADDAHKLVETICGIMVKCLYGGPEFLRRAMPVSSLSSSLLMEQSRPILDIINGHRSGKVIAIIADGRRINQKCFRTIAFEEDKPRIYNGDTFLLYSYLHIFKCLRNNWLIDKCGELKYEFNGVVRLAKRNNLKILYIAEADGV